MDSKTLRDIFTEDQLHHILKQIIGDHKWKLIAYDIKPAAEGLTGFLGDHWRVTLHVKVDVVTKVQLFVKSMPAKNGQKARFIEEGNFFKRERLMFQMFEELGGAEGPNPWRTKAYIYSDSLLVMPDLAAEGYSPRPYYETLNLPHTLLTAASIARFHAAYTNYATHKTNNGHHYSFLDEHGPLVKDPTFCDSLWLHTAAKLSAKLLETFSLKYDKGVPELEAKLLNLYLEACDGFKECKNSLNVVIHKDLWANNIMFRYKNEVPVNSLLIDYQCLRYGPPAFDLTIFLYLTTSRSFRQQHEREIYLHYYAIFVESLQDSSKTRLKDLKYDVNEFLEWCERARMFGMFMAIGIYPYVLMDPVTAQRVFDDPETYLEYCNVDRNGPVVEYARTNDVYRDRQLEVTEEFVERYILKLC